MARIISPFGLVGGGGGKGWSINCAGLYYTQGGDILDITTEDFEISFWMRQDGDPVSSSSIISKTDDASNPAKRWGLRINTIGALVLQADDDTNAANFQFDVTAFLDDVWHHYYVFADRSDISSCTIYVDGVSKTISTTGTFPVNSLVFGAPRNLTVGSTHNGSTINTGYLRDVRIKIGGTMATPTQIEYQAANPLDYSSSSWNTADGTREYWPLNEGSGTTNTAGVSSPANDLTLTNVLGWERGMVPR